MAVFGTTLRQTPSGDEGTLGESFRGPLNVLGRRGGWLLLRYSTDFG